MRERVRAACPEAAKRFKVQRAGGAHLHALWGMGDPGKVCEGGF